MLASQATTHVLSPQVSDDLATLRTAAALQQHQEWVSQESGRIPGLLAGPGFSLVGTVINPITTGGQAYVAVRGSTAVIAFRGTGGENLKQTTLNALADVAVLRVVPREILGSKARSRIRVHLGFYENYLEFRQEIAARVRSLGVMDLYVTGFSLGSALATLCALDLAIQGNSRVTLHAFATPRVGNAAFSELVAAKVPNTLRTTLRSDPVPRVPLTSSNRRGFRHVGGLLALEEDGAPVPLLQITGRLLDAPQLQSHNRDKYKTMLAQLITRAEARPKLLAESWGAVPLHAAAEAERGPISEPRDDDEEA